jgi:hypothetical protein
MALLPGTTTAITLFMSIAAGPLIIMGEGAITIVPVIDTIIDAVIATTIKL